MAVETKTIYHEGIDGYVYIRAKAFLDLANEIEGKYHQDHVASMNRAFACELFLKCLWVKTETKFKLETFEGGEVRQKGPPEIRHQSIHGHKLSMIFDELPQEIGRGIAETYEREFGKPIAPDLAACEDLFVDLRYLHEKTSFSYPAGLLSDLAAFLCRVVEAEMKRQIGQ